MNKIKVLICCNLEETHNNFHHVKIKDLQWKENDTYKLTIMFSHMIPSIKSFIAQAEKKHYSTLVFCNNGQNRSLCIIVCYLMERFNWSFYKSLQYLDSKRSNLEISKNFFNSLKNVCQEFEENHSVSVNWSD